MGIRGYIRIFCVTCRLDGELIKQQQLTAKQALKCQQKRVHDYSSPRLLVFIPTVSAEKTCTEEYPGIYTYSADDDTNGGLVVIHISNQRFSTLSIGTYVCLALLSDTLVSAASRPLLRWHLDINYNAPLLLACETSC